ncbi:MAG: hypothetical protein ACK5KT_01010 [Dysgonomonas sp.]
MKQLMKSKLLLLLTEALKRKNELAKLEEAYDEFAITLLDKLQSETNVTKLYYNLGFVRLELAELRDIPFGEKGKKCLKVYY